MTDKRKDLKKIAVVGKGFIGHVGLGRTCVTTPEMILKYPEYFNHLDENVLIVVNERTHLGGAPRVNFVTINGNRYEPINDEKGSNNLLNSRRAQLTQMLQDSADNYSLTGSGKKKNLTEGLEIVKEFELIDRKESNLSKVVRDAVVDAFFKQYRLVD